MTAAHGPSFVPPLILGSGSPRRADLIGALGVAFVVEPPGIVEPPDADVAALARAKFEHLAPRHKGRTVLTADTLVYVDGRQLGKPVDRADAHDMLSACSGRAILVRTAVCVGTSDVFEYATRESIVQLRELSADEIDHYLASGAADDKAGALGLQAEAASFIDRQAPSVTAACDDGGCFSNVAGLPMCLVAAALAVPVTPSLCAWPF